MIITRTPFRVSLCGGGSDIKSFYEKHGGCVLSTTINKYMYITSHPSFDKKTTVLKYSKTTGTPNISDIIMHNILSILKNAAGLYSLNKVAIVFNTLKPSE